MPEPIRRLLELLDEPTDRQRLAIDPHPEVIDLPGSGPVIVPHPPMFQKAPVVSGMDAAKAIGQLLRFAPALQGRMGNVIQGYSKDAADMLDGSNALAEKKHRGMVFKSPEDFGETNILGLTDMRNGNMTLNPALRPKHAGEPSVYDLDPIVAHEGVHVAGYGDDKAYEAQHLVEQLGGIPQHPTPTTKPQGYSLLQAILDRQRR